MESIRLKLIETDDIAELIDVMRNLNIETKGCRDVEQMRDRICKVLEFREHQLDPNKVFIIINRNTIIMQWIHEKSFQITFCTDKFETISR